MILVLHQNLLDSKNNLQLKNTLRDTIGCFVKALTKNVQEFLIILIKDSIKFNSQDSNEINNNCNLIALMNIIITNTKLNDTDNQIMF